MVQQGGSVVLEGEEDQSNIHMNEDSIMKPTKHCLKKGG
jgi:hypothetical protein